MTQLSGYSFLIVDPSWLWAYDLRAHLVRKGASVHIVNSAASALTFARSKRIDAALMGYGLDRETKQLQSALDELGVPVVFTSAPTLTNDDGGVANNFFVNGLKARIADSGQSAISL